MSWWNAKYKNNHGEYEITFASKSYEKAKAVERICQAVIDKKVKSREDVSAVVRCKVCKHCKLCYPEKQIDKEATPGWYCKEHKSYRRPDDFCSYGERREGE